MSEDFKINKEKADPNLYYNLFKDKIGAFQDDDNVLLIHIGNFDVIRKFMINNINCNYFIIDQVGNKNWFQINFPSAKIYGTGEDESIIEALEKIDMKFDKIIMNPPYSKNLHLKILAKAIEKLTDDGTCVNLSPIRWLQDPLAEYKKSSDFKRFEESIVKYINEFILVPFQIAENIFINTRFSYDLGIIKIIKSQKKTNISFLNPTIKSILNKVIGKTKSIDDYIDKNMIDGWRVKISFICGGPHPGQVDDKKLFYRKDVYNNGYQNGKHWTDTPKTKNQYSKKIGDPFPMSIKFNNELEANNFYNCCVNTFMHFLNFTTKGDVNVPLRWLPCMIDVINPRTGLKGYESEWTNEDFYQYFNITPEEQKIIEETMEKYK